VSSVFGLAYTPFGLPQSGALPEPFGFTGELHSNDLVYLRARWYDPASGTFASRDPFDGFERLPYSLHPYQYGYSNPTMYTDPSGEFIIEMRYNPIGATANFAYHAYIVLSCPDDCTELYVRGGTAHDGLLSGSGSSPSSEEGGSSESSGESGSSQDGGSSGEGGSSEWSNQNSTMFGLLVTEYGEYKLDTVDWTTDHVPSVEVLNNDEPCDTYYAQLTRYTDRVEDAEIQYDPLTTNSNATAHNALEHIGYPVTDRPVWAPGWDTDLAPYLDESDD
jgi:RHS repeat-associated protein